MLTTTDGMATNQQLCTGNQSKLTEMVSGAWSINQPITLAVKTVTSDLSYLFCTVIY